MGRGLCTCSPCSWQGGAGAGRWALRLGERAQSVHGQSCVSGSSGVGGAARVDVEVSDGSWLTVRFSFL